MRERRHPILQRLKRMSGRDADHVGAGRQKLPELDVGRAKPGDGDREAASLILPAGQLSRQRQRRAKAGRRNGIVDLRKHAFARHHETRMRQPPKVKNRSEHRQRLRVSSRNGSPQRRLSAA